MRFHPVKYVTMSVTVMMGLTNLAVNVSRLCTITGISNKLASMRENLSVGVCEHQMHRPACASAQTESRLCY